MSKYICIRTCLICNNQYQARRQSDRDRLCPNCDAENGYIYQDEITRLYNQLDRATKAGNIATLTLPDWINILEKFAYKCAYCQQKTFQLMEHIISINDGGGTTTSNCVPSCNSCNTLKANGHLPKDWIDRVICNHC